MKYVLLLALVLIIIFSVIFYYSKEQSILRHKLLVVNSQNTSLRSELAKYKKSKEPIKIKFSIPNNPMGIIKENSNILIAPIENSALLHKNKIKMEVRILDKAQIKNQSWYYISLPVDDDINSRGWIQQKDFSLFYDNSKNIRKV